MKLLIRRNQRAGLVGKQVFSVEVRADISNAEKENINKYKLGKTILYESHEITGGSGLLGLASRAAYNAIRISVTVDDLAFGKKVECKDIVEMIAIEEQITQAAKSFKAVLEAAAQFGGEEVVTL
jgi:F420-0:gamma-glutamyl ligase-like protein